MQTTRRPSILGLNRSQWRAWSVSLALYVLFAGGIFFLIGPRPLLGSDHLSYMRVAAEIANARPDGDYWPEVNSVRSFSVMLAWLHPFTHSYVLSMRLVLAAISVPYLLAADLLLGLFTAGRWTRRIFALLSGFAVSFGVASWGITDYTALMPRTLVMPAIFFSVWFYLRYFHRTWRYAVFVLLVLFSILHLSTFYLIGVLVIFEAFDFLIIRRRKVDGRLVAFPCWLLVTLAVLLAVESTGVIVGGTSYVTTMIFPSKRQTQTASNDRDSKRRTGDLETLDGLFRGKISAIDNLDAAGAKLPRSGPQLAWKFELASRPWRNMPLPWINLANIFASFGLILLLGIAGSWIAFRGSPRELDLIMACWVPANLIFALGPQTALWILRQFTGIYPINIEEIRSLSFLMIPCLYFGVRLFEWLGAQGGRASAWGRPAFVILFLALPLMMKSLTLGAREKLFSGLTYLHVIGTAPAAVSNARSALGLSYSTQLYYPVQGLSRWLEENARDGSLVLTERDDMLPQNVHFVGSHQEVALQDFGSRHAQIIWEIYRRLKAALAERDLVAATELAKQIRARYVVVPWPVEGAAYRDQYFSLIDLQPVKAAR